MAEIEDDDVVPIKVGFAGATHVGKTSLLMKLFDQNYDIMQVKSTTGGNCQKANFEYNNKIYELALWDTAGQEKYRSTALSYLRGSDVILFVYSITDEDSFSYLRPLYNDINENALDLSKDTKSIIVGNKNDLRYTSEGSKIVKDDDAIQFAQEISAKFILTSAVTLENLGELCELIVKSMEEKPEHVQGLKDEYKQPKPKSNPNPKSCC